MKRIAIAAMILVLATPAISLAQQARQGQGPRTGVARTRVDMAEKLNLTDQQKEQIRKLRTDMQRTRIEQSAKVRLARLDMRELMAADSPDRSAIERKMREVSDLELKLKMAQLDNHLAVQKILTPEQRKIWRENAPGIGREVRQRMQLRRMAPAPFGALGLEDEDDDLPGLPGEEIEIEIE